MSWQNDLERGEIHGRVTVPAHFNGYPGVVHGGIVAAILDETAGRAILLSGDEDNLMMTLKLEVVYRHPTPTGIPLTAVGRVIRRSSRRAQVESRIHLQDGTVTASCTALIVRPPPETAAAWEAEKPYWRVE